ncbi:uncharacterized protein METZ01_LOCUS457003, partial [marine metagenome]
VVAPTSDATDVTIPTEVQTASTLDEIPLDVAIAETVEEDPVETFVVAPTSDATDVTIPTEVQTASTLDETPLDVAIVETAEEDPVETVVVTETIENAPESEVSSDELWLKTPATDYSVYPATDTVEIAAQAESLAVAA